MLLIPTVAESAFVLPIVLVLVIVIIALALAYKVVPQLVEQVAVDSYSHGRSSSSDISDS